MNFKKISGLMIGSAFALALVFGGATQASAGNFNLGGSLSGSFSGESDTDSRSDNWGNGTIHERNSWSGGVSESFGDMEFTVNTGSGVSGGYTGGSSAESGAGAYTEQVGGGANFSRTRTSSQVGGSFSGSASGGGSFANNP